MRHTARKLRHVGDKGAIFGAPKDDDLVPVAHVNSPADYIEE
jgi:hypothetical protein